MQNRATVDISEGGGTWQHIPFLLPCKIIMRILLMMAMKKVTNENDDYDNDDNDDHINIDNNNNDHNYKNPNSQ